MTSSRVKWHDFNKWWHEFSITWGTCLQREEINKAISDKLKELQKGVKNER